MFCKQPRAYDADSRRDPHFPHLSLDDYYIFPDPENAHSSVLAVGGNLSPGMIVSAYSQGVFPWFNDEDPLYWQSPDPRFVVLPGTFHIPSRLRRTIKSNQFEIRVDTAFERVINSCSAVVRKDQYGSWITEDMIDAYLELHREGLAHSVEAWQNNTLVGGLYGIQMGQAFFGESMFTRVADAAKVAFAVFATHFFGNMGGSFIDSQVYTDHISRFGGINISRSAYLRKLSTALDLPCISDIEGSCCIHAGEQDSVTQLLLAGRGMWPADLLTSTSSPVSELL